MTAGKHRFVEFYVADPKRNGTAAYLKAFECTRSAASARASELLACPQIQGEIARLEREEVKAKQAGLDRAGLTQALMLQHLHEIVTADPRDLIEFRRGACRYCHGAGHLYQFTARELRDAYAAFLLTPAGKEDSTDFDMQGGDGFTPKRDAHPDCPECFGEGVGYEFVKDTRKLTPAAARLYAGMKITKEGIEIKTRGQDKMIGLAMQHLGMLNDKTDDGETAETKAAEVRALVAALGATIGKPPE